jgi:hypothetical protein
MSRLAARPVQISGATCPRHGGKSFYNYLSSLLTIRLPYSIHSFTIVAGSKQMTAMAPAGRRKVSRTQKRYAGTTATNQGSSEEMNPLLQQVDTQQTAKGTSLQNINANQERMLATLERMEVTQERMQATQSAWNLELKGFESRLTKVIRSTNDGLTKEIPSSTKAALSKEIISFGDELSEKLDQPSEKLDQLGEKLDQLNDRMKITIAVLLYDCIILLFAVYLAYIN